MGLVDSHAHGLHAGEGVAGEVVGVAVRAVPVCNLNGQVQHRRARRVAHVEGRAVDRQRLQRRAHRHLQLIGAVELLLLHGLAAPAHHGHQLAGVPVDHRCCGLGLHHGQVLAAAQRGLGGGVVGIAHGRVLGPVGDGVLHGGLHRGIQRGVDDVAAVAQLGFHAAAVGGAVLQALDAQHLGHNVVDGVLHVVGVVVHGVGGGGGGLQHVQRLRLGGVALLLADQALVEHLLQHVVGALVDQLGALVHVVVSAGVVAVGVANDGGDAGALAQGELVEILAEVVLGRDLHAVVCAAQVDHVQVGLQDLLLRQLLLHLQGQIGLLHLALVVLVGVEQRQLDQLAGDGGRALQAAARQVVEHRARHALDVHAVVLPEARVLDGDDRVDQLLRNLLVVHVDAVLGALELGNEVAVLVVDEGGEGLRADLLDVQLRAGVHPGLRHAAHQACCGQ